MSREKVNRTNKALVHWDELLEAIDAMTEEYEESGWKTLALHPGDVTTVTDGTEDGEVGFRLVAPQSEFDALTEMVNGDEDSYDEFEVHRGPDDDLLLFVVVVRSAERGRAVLFPLYYDPRMDRDFVQAVRESDTVSTQITNLEQSKRCSFSHDKPSLFLP